VVGEEVSIHHVLILVGQGGVHCAHCLVKMKFLIKVVLRVGKFWLKVWLNVKIKLQVNLCFFSVAFYVEVGVISNLPKAVEFMYEAI
jgi:hypothetical protein